MEAINNMAGAASKAIWGEGANASGEEPVSGQKGAGTTEEPFDKGNEEAPAENKPTTSGVDTSSATNGDAPAQKQQGADRPGEAPGPENTEAIKKTKESAESSASKDKESAESSSSKDKPKVPHTDEEREEAMQKGEFPHDPNDHSGEPLKIHDGSEKKTERSESVSHEGGGTLGGPAKGMGKEVVKASGVAADGGDFDATKPGAGSEANRLLEEQGVHKSKPDDPSDTTSTSPSPSDKLGKPSKMTKLKEKLHIKKSSSTTE